MTIREIPRKFPMNLSAIKYFEQIRWGKKPKCAYCGSKKLSKRLKDLRFKCYSCNRTTYVTVGTFLHGTNIKLIVWLKALLFVSNAENGITPRQISNDIRTCHATSWKIFCKIRDLLSIQDDALGVKYPKIRGKIQRDGGILSRLNMASLKTTIKYSKGRSIKHVYKNKRKKILQVGEEIDSIELSKIIQIIYNPGRSYAGDINNAFWDLVERQIKAKHNEVDIRHIDRYILEAVFEINKRKDIDMFETLVINSMRETYWTKTKRIQYKK